MSRDYGRVSTAFWKSQAIRELGDRGKLLANYLITNPHSNLLGAYLLPDAYIADDLDWSVETVRKTLAELFEKGFATRFADGRHIVVCKFLQWNPIENPNVGRAAMKLLDQLPDDPAIAHIISGLELYIKHFPDGLETVRKRLCEPFRNQEQEQKPEQKQEKNLSASADGPVFEDFWKPYPTDKNMSRKAAEAQWKRMTPEKRTAAVVAIPGFLAYCAANSWYRPVHAERFLSQERFEGYAAVPAPLVETDPSWGTAADKVTAEVGDGNFQSFFADARLVDGDPQRIQVRSPIKKRLIEQKFPKHLRRALGDVVIEVVA